LSDASHKIERGTNSDARAVDQWGEGSRDKVLFRGSHGNPYDIGIKGVDLISDQLDHAVTYGSERGCIYAVDFDPGVSAFRLGLEQLERGGGSSYEEVLHALLTALVEALSEQ
jgi:hypothetical protein